MRRFLHHLDILSGAFCDYIGEDLLSNVLAAEVVGGSIRDSLSEGLAKDVAACKEVMHPSTAFGVRHDTFDIM